MARRGQKGADNVSIFGPGQWLQGFVLFVIIDQARQNNACLCFYVCVAYINQSLFCFFFFKAAILSPQMCQGIWICNKILVMVIKPLIASATGSHGKKTGFSA